MIYILVVFYFLVPVLYLLSVLLDYHYLLLANAVGSVSMIKKKQDHSVSDCLVLPVLCLQEGGREGRREGGRREERGMRCVCVCGRGGVPI